MPNLLAVQLVPGGKLHYLERVTPSLPILRREGDGALVLAPRTLLMCRRGRVVRPLPIEVRDSSVLHSDGRVVCDECARRTYRAATLADLPPWAAPRASEDRWILMRMDIERAVTAAYPERSKDILDELHRRAPIDESLSPHEAAKDDPLDRATHPGQVRRET